MTSDALVTSRLILEAVNELERRGADQALRTLEQIEPELLNYVLERLSALHGRLIALGGPPKRTARALRYTQTTILICITAMRAAHFAEWNDNVIDTTIDQLNRLVDPEQQDADGEDLGQAPQPEGEGNGAR